MHAQERSILQQNTRREIVYYYPFNDYNTIIIFNAIIMVSSKTRSGMNCSGTVPEKAGPNGITGVFPWRPVIVVRSEVRTKKEGPART
jgi:hypothetical protein